MSLCFNVFQLILAYLYWLVGHGLVLSLKERSVTALSEMFTTLQTSWLRQLWLLKGLVCSKWNSYAWNISHADRYWKREKESLGPWQIGWYCQPRRKTLQEAQLYGTSFWTQSWNWMWPQALPDATGTIRNLFSPHVQLLLGAQKNQRYLNLRIFVSFKSRTTE